MNNVANNVANNAIILGSSVALRDMIRSNLKSAGFKVLESSASGKAVLETLSDASVSCQLLFCDVQVDGMQCRNFLAEIRKMPDFSSMMIVLLAADLEQEEAEACLGFGIAGIIKKPCNSGSISSVLQSTYQRLKSFNGNFKALFLYTAAAFFDSLGRHRAAIQSYEQSLVEYDSAAVHFDLARVYLARHNKTKALEHFSKAEQSSSTFKPLVVKLLSQYQAINGEDSSIPSAALKTFAMPLDHFGRGFYNSQRIQKAMIVGGSHQERTSVKTFLGILGVQNVLLKESAEDALKMYRIPISI